MSNFTAEFITYRDDLAAMEWRDIKDVAESVNITDKPADKWEDAAEIIAIALFTQQNKQIYIDVPVEGDAPTDSPPPEENTAMSEATKKTEQPKAKTDKPAAPTRKLPVYATVKPDDLKAAEKARVIYFKKNKIPYCPKCKQQNQNTSNNRPVCPASGADGDCPRIKKYEAHQAELKEYEDE